MKKDKEARPKGLNWRTFLAFAGMIAMIMLGEGCSRIHGGYMRGTIPSQADLEKRVQDASAPLTDSERDHFAGLVIGTSIEAGVCQRGDTYLRCRERLQDIETHARNTLLCTVACGENSPLLTLCIRNDVPTAHPEMGTSITCDAAVAATMTDAQLEVTRTRDRVADATREIEAARNLAETRRLAAEGQRDAERRRADDAERRLAAAQQAQPTPPPPVEPPQLAIADDPAPTQRRQHRQHRQHAATTTPRDTEPNAAQTWRTPPTGFVVGFPSAPEVACSVPANGETRCVSIGPHGVAQMAALTSATGVTSHEVHATGVTSLSHRWHHVGDHSNERVAALLSNNPQPWGPFVIACLATEQPEHGRPVYVSSRWGRRPGNAVNNMTIAEFQTQRATGRCRSGTTTIHVTGQPVRVVLDFTVGETWNHAMDPPSAPQPTASLAFSPATHTNVHRAEVATRAGVTTRGFIASVSRIAVSITWWFDPRWRYQRPSALA